MATDFLKRDERRGGKVSLLAALRRLLDRLINHGPLFSDHKFGMHAAGNKALRILGERSASEPAANEPTAEETELINRICMHNPREEEKCGGEPKPLRCVTPR